MQYKEMVGKSYKIVHALFSIYYLLYDSKESDRKESMLFLCSKKKEVPTRVVTSTRMTKAATDSGKGMMFTC